MLWLIGFSMRAMMPRTAALPGIEDTDVNGFLRRMRVEAEPLFWWGLVMGAWVHFATPLFTVGLPLPACFLPKTLLYRHTERLLAHRLYFLRQAVFVVRLCAGMCWGADTRVRAAFSLPPLPPDPATFRES